MSIYGPLDWEAPNTQARHADAGDNLASGVTLVEAGAVGLVYLEVANGTKTTVTGVTVGGIAVVTGVPSGIASGGVDFTLSASSAPTPSSQAAGDYWVKITLDRSDGTKEVVRAPLTIHAGP
jgi:hypothetical protein